MVFLAEVLRGHARFLAFLCASGTCARRARRRTRSGAAVGGAAPVTAQARGRTQECTEQRSSVTRAWPNERTALSRHRTGARSSRRKRGLIRRFGIVFPVAVVAAIAVIGVAVGAEIFAPGTSAFSAIQAIEAVPGSRTMTLLEAEREQLITMTAAANTMDVVAEPKLASPAKVAAALGDN